MIADDPRLDRVVVAAGLDHRGHEQDSASLTKRFPRRSKAITPGLPRSRKLGNGISVPSGWGTSETGVQAAAWSTSSERYPPTRAAIRAPSPVFDAGGRCVWFFPAARWP